MSLKDIQDFIKQWREDKPDPSLDKSRYMRLYQSHRLVPDPHPPGSRVRHVVDKTSFWKTVSSDSPPLSNAQKTALVNNWKVRIDTAFDGQHHLYDKAYLVLDKNLREVKEILFFGGRSLTHVKTHRAKWNQSRGDFEW
jgi:hypothetical protein